MKFFIAYKFKGEEPKELEKAMKIVCQALEEGSHGNYCTLWDKNIQSVNKSVLFNHAFQEIDKADGVLVFMKSEEKSEGMLIEIGYAMAKKKRIILLIKKSIKNTRLRDLIKEKIEFDNLEELKEKLKQLK